MLGTSCCAGGHFECCYAAITWQRGGRRFLKLQLRYVNTPQSLLCPARLRLFLLPLVRGASEIRTGGLASFEYTLEPSTLSTNDASKRKRRTKSRSREESKLWTRSFERIRVGLSVKGEIYLGEIPHAVEQLTPENEQLQRFHLSGK